LRNEEYGTESEMKVLAHTPLESRESHKLAYIISDRRFNQPNRIQIMPYLHENKIYLNRIKRNTFYFITSLETPMTDLKAYNEPKDVTEFKKSERDGSAYQEERQQ